ncbi:MAG: response regulator [Acidobacteria bacterium]|nr:MAG: response regulator [Acidobacteriota bacterium]
MKSDDIRRVFGTAIKRWRERAHISQEELAWRAALHRSYVADIERGVRNASLQTIEKLADALGVSLAVLFEPVNGLRKAADTPAPAKAEETPGPMDILMVEDDPRDVELTLQAFRDAGITNRVAVVRDGANALDYLFCLGPYARLEAEPRPGVVLLDLHLPKVHGLEVLRRVKSNHGTAQIPVIVLTVSRDDEDVLEATRLGADAYILKPVDFSGLSAVTPQLQFTWTLCKGQSV